MYGFGDEDYEIDDDDNDDGDGRPIRYVEDDEDDDFDEDEDFENNYEIGLQNLPLDYEIDNDDDYDELDDEDDDDEENNSITDATPMKIGDIIYWGEDNFEMECVYRIKYDDHDYILLHPTDAPKDIQFVPMRVDIDEDTNEETLAPVTSEFIANRVLDLYIQFCKRK